MPATLPVPMPKKDRRSSGSDRLLVGRPTGGDTAVDAIPDLTEEDVWQLAGGPGTQLGLLLMRNPPHSGYRRGAFREAAASAPVDVPEWRVVAEDEEEAPCGEDRWVPPHEYLQQVREKADGGGRKLVTSVVEGAGRTLKGRDASRVRDAVWRRTGFSG